MLVMESRCVCPSIPTPIIAICGSLLNGTGGALAVRSRVPAARVGDEEAAVLSGVIDFFRRRSRWRSFEFDDRVCFVSVFGRDLCFGGCIKMSTSALSMVTAGKPKSLY